MRVLRSRRVIGVQSVIDLKGMILTVSTAVISLVTAFVITSDRLVIDERLNVPAHYKFVTNCGEFSLIRILLSTEFPPSPSEPILFAVKVGPHCFTLVKLII